MDIPLGHVQVDRHYGTIVVPGRTDNERLQYAQLLYTEPGTFIIPNYHRGRRGRKPRYRLGQYWL